MSNSPAIGVFTQKPPVNLNPNIDCSNAVPSVYIAYPTDIYTQTNTATNPKPLYVALNGITYTISTDNTGSMSDLNSFLAGKNILRTIDPTGNVQYTNLGFGNVKLFIYGGQTAFTSTPIEPVEAPNTTAEQENLTFGAINDGYVGFYACLASGLALTVSYTTNTGSYPDPANNAIAYNNQVGIKLSWNANVFNVGDTWRIVVGSIVLSGQLNSTNIANGFVIAPFTTFPVGVNTVQAIVANLTTSNTLSKTTTLDVGNPVYYTSNPYPYVFTDSLKGGTKGLQGTLFEDQFGDQLTGNAIGFSGSIVQYINAQQIQPNEDKLVGTAIAMTGDLVQYVNASMTQPNEDKLTGTVVALTGSIKQYINANYNTPLEDRLTSQFIGVSGTLQ